MKLLILHDAPRGEVVSGEHQSTMEQSAALASAGHTIEWLGSRDGLPLGPRAVGRAIVAAQPDVTLVHKWFPAFSRVTALPGPAVYFVHNFLPVCIAATFSRAGRRCQDCVTKGRHAGVVHGCYRGGRLWSAAASELVRRQRERGLLVSSNHVVFPSETARAVFISIYPELEARSSVVPGFVDRPAATPSPPAERRGFVYVGQLEEFKGILQIVESWPLGMELVVIGSGSAELKARQLARGKQIEFRGRLGPDEVRQAMAEARALIFAGTSPETFGRVHAEACSVGLPTIAIRGSNVACEVERLGTGIVCDDIHALVRACETWSFPSATRMVDAYFRNYTVDAWLARIQPVLRGVAESSQRRGGAP